MNPYPKIILQLISYFQKLPGVGKKTAERYVFSILKWKPNEQQALGNLFKSINEELSHCTECNALKENNCLYCTDSRKKTQKLCITSSMQDLYKIEQTKIFSGLYYILPHLLSPLDGYHTESLPLSPLHNYIKNNQVQEVILVLDNTIEGDATSLYLKEQLKGVSLYRLASGLPLGSPIDYIDQGTLHQALTEKKPL